jgi:hypothetical protein
MSKCSSLIEKNCPIILLIYTISRVCDGFVVMVKLSLDLKLDVIKLDIIELVEHVVDIAKYIFFYIIRNIKFLMI